MFGWIDPCGGGDGDLPLGRVDNAGVCNSLEAKVRTGATGALLNELDAQRGKHVNDAGYLLLGWNVRALPPVQGAP